MANATGNVHIKETAMRISQNIKDITENCVTCFKEIVLTGVPLDKTGELGKVSWLRWDTEMDEIFVDIKTGEKKKGTHMKNSLDLNCTEANLPH